MKTHSLILTIFCALNLFGQAIRPKIMVVPSKDWCNENNFMRTIDNQGNTEYISDWEAALVKRPDLNSVIAKISGEMSKRKFSLENLQSTIDQIKQDRLEEGVRGDVMSSPIDQVRAKAKADIELHLYWKIETQGPKKRVTNFRIIGIDTYSNKQVADAIGSVDWVLSAQVSDAELLYETVQSKMDQFERTLQTHFDDLLLNGREINFNVYLRDGWGKDFSTEEFGDDELSYLIKVWLSKSTVQGRTGTNSSTKTRLQYSGTRIPLYDSQNMAINAADFARDFKRYLKSLGIPSDQIEIDGVGLGKVNIFIGPK
jgi:hypothetical protein